MRMNSLALPKTETPNHCGTEARVCVEEGLVEDSRAQFQPLQPAAGDRRSEPTVR